MRDEGACTRMEPACMPIRTPRSLDTQVRADARGKPTFLEGAVEQTFCGDATAARFLSCYAIGPCSLPAESLLP